MKNSRWRTTAILKTVKMPYLCSCSNEIWHGDAYCSYEPDQLPEISYGGLENKKNSLNNDTLHNKFRNKTAGWFAAERSAAGDIDRLQAPALSSRRGQCHVDSRGTRLNTDLLNRERVRLFCSNTQNEI